MSEFCYIDDDDDDDLTERQMASLFPNVIKKRLLISPLMV